MRIIEPNTLSLLRETTRDLHDLTERVPVLAPLSDGKVTKDQYRDALAAIYGFYSPAEELLFRTFPHLEKFLVIQPKVPSLRHDLIALGLNELDVELLPICKMIPELDNLEQGIGMSYVLEGATLGGQVVLRKVSHCLGNLAQQATTFHNFHGEQTGVHWRTFQKLLTEQLDQELVCQERAIQSAVDTFKSLNCWLSNWKIAH